MQNHKLKFPVSNQVEIVLMNKLKYVMALLLVTFLISSIYKGNEYWLTPFTEWATTILYINYFAILSFTNTYFDSIHPFDVAAPVT